MELAHHSSQNLGSVSLSKALAYACAIGKAESANLDLSPWTMWLFHRCWCPVSSRASTACSVAGVYLKLSFHVARTRSTLLKVLRTVHCPVCSNLWTDRLFYLLSENCESAQQQLLNL